jgi:hypothetical protein
MAYVALSAFQWKMEKSACVGMTKEQQNPSKLHLHFPHFPAFPAKMGDWQE